MNTNTSTNPGLFESAICLSLTLSSFSVQRKGDKNQMTVDADKSMLTFGKKILQSKELKEITQLDSEIYDFLHWKEGSHSLPFEFKPGVYLIPLALIDEVERRLGEFAYQRILLVEEFLGVYQDRVKEAQQKLGVLFNHKDYPSVAKLEGKFSMKWQIFGFDAPESLKNTNVFLYQKEKEKIRKQCEEAELEIMSLLRKEALNYINGLVSKLSPSIDGKQKRLHESYVEKMRDFFDTFEARNIANDEQLSEAIQIARASIDGASIEDLRDNEGLRQQVKLEFTAAASVFDAMLDDADEFAA